MRMRSLRQASPSQFPMARTSMEKNVKVEMMMQAKISLLMYPQQTKMSGAQKESMDGQRDAFLDVTNVAKCPNRLLIAEKQGKG